MAGVLLVAGVVTIAIVLSTTSDGQKNNHSDSPGVAAAYAAAFASSPPLTVATYNDCAQLLAARDAILRASKDGVTRQQLRTLLRRDGELVPPDETWTGGIMQLYGACRRDSA